MRHCPALRIAVATAPLRNPDFDAQGPSPFLTSLRRAHPAGTRRLTWIKSTSKRRLRCESSDPLLIQINRSPRPCT
ncbi:hypothetical protein CSC74_10295 [Pseudoxanthomonas yeongjuensis]|nr:hypothetical protein CSC74_10295 [Pseudoxanthomonas yeongjuensis]